MLNNVIILNQSIRPELFYTWVIGFILCVCIASAYYNDYKQIKGIKRRKQTIKTYKVYQQQTKQVA